MLVLSVNNSNVLTLDASVVDSFPSLNPSTSSEFNNT